MKAVISNFLTAMLTWECQACTNFSSNPISSTSQLNNQETPMTNPMRPTSPVSFIPGPPIQPSSELLNWLNNETQTNSGSRTRLRLPVVIYFQDSYRLALGDAFIGISNINRDNDAIFLSLSDSAMSVSLLSTLRDLCPTTENSCAVWLEGYWGPPMELNLPQLSAPKQDRAKKIKSPFSVLKVHELIQEQLGQDEEVRVLIESPSP